jgi:NSS family neurotransmitter:Na+ symporter
LRRIKTLICRLRNIAMTKWSSGSGERHHMSTSTAGSTPEVVPRAQWATRRGFILATLGAAIGIGNIWRFPYVMGENGGAAFLIVYLGVVLIVGVPMVLGELALGRAARREAASAFEHFGRDPLWRKAGVLGVLASFAILTYYAVVSGWALKYFVGFATVSVPQPGAAARYFEHFTSGREPLLWHVLMLAAVVTVVSAGVERGIERASKVLMPMLVAIVVLLALHSLTLPNAGSGLAYLLALDWEALARPQVYLAALGQAFFSLGVAMGVLVTYGSYISANQRLPTASLIIALGDTLFAVVAALLIFPAVFSFGMSPAQGPALAFVVLPEIFSRMSYGLIVGTAFFGLLVVAALTSLIALVEICVAFAVERWKMRRASAIALVASAGFLLGVPSLLSYGALSAVSIAGRPILDAVDFAASNILLPLSGLAVTLFVGWHWRIADALPAVGIRSPIVFRLWRFSLRYAAPLMIVIVLLRALSLV